MRAEPWLLGLLGAIACGGPPPEARPTPIPEAWKTDTGSAFFIQMADIQFGMWSKPGIFSYFGWPWNEDSFVRETHDMEKAIALASRLRPLFVIMCGDLVNTPGHAGQIAEFGRIAGQLDEGVPFYVLAGNHDVGNEPTPESLSQYRDTFGEDWYAFRHGPVLGIVLNSQLIHSPDGAPKEEAAQLAWLRAELARAKDTDAAHILVFQHHPFFLEAPDEKDQYFNLPRKRRGPYLALFREAGVRAVFAGHYHRNAHGWDGSLEMVTTGPVGRPLGDDPSGLRIVRVGEHYLDHAYFALDQVPESLGSH